MNENIGPVKQCVGCGFCCLKAKCDAGNRLYKGTDVCNALTWSEKDNRYYCSLMQKPGNIGREYREELYAGEGCCCGLNSWRQDVKRRDIKKTIRPQFKTLDPFFQKFLYSMAREWISGEVKFFIISGFMNELKKDGVDEAEIKSISTLVTHYIKSQSSKMVDGFMGGMK